MEDNIIVMILLSIIISLSLIFTLTLVLIVLKKKDKALFGSFNKFARPIAAIVLIAIIGFCPFFFTGLFNHYNPTGYSEWRDAGNNQQYLYVEAENYYDLGYHEGYNLGSEILSIEILISLMISGYDYAYYKVEAAKYQEFIPSDYIEEMQGMAKGATAKTGSLVTFEDILIQNTFIDIIYAQIYPTMDEPGAEIACSVVGVKENNSTKTYGQNFDFPRVINNKGWGEKGYLPGLAWVHTKMPGKAEIFGLRMGGMLNMPCAMNSYGIKTFVNIVHSNASGEYQTPTGILSRKALESGKTSQEIVEMIIEDFNSPKIPCSFNVMIIDDTSIIGMQCYPEKYQLYASPFVSTNRYINETWNEACFTRGNYSLDRQQYLEAYVEDIFNSTSHFTEQNLLDLLKYRGTDTTPAITREDEGLANSITLAFMTNTYFGLGNAYDGLGKIPSLFL
ncbi:hypothetical protein NEF87_004202 [Candidatus Lokiarchaeum ossiferum]|uniref:Peptidase C45 hydrolase domain-containing protein n=1 Tax=Candidatus Lokiarchaeum ossiferum TaxID=2951803 RepID=A0ABY6I010_9ARCH|nr:hypothetical protein NEF87_004202 [Candidatus Lokiarchaeum sp. B-35]